jgi:hypothetical protein
MRRHVEAEVPFAAVAVGNSNRHGEIYEYSSTKGNVDKHSINGKSP